jgi:hypothetical protein
LIEWESYNKFLIVEPRVDTPTSLVVAIHGNDGLRDWIHARWRRSGRIGSESNGQGCGLVTLAGAALISSF